MSDYNRINSNDLDRYITGNYGEDQLKPKLTFDQWKEQVNLAISKVVGMSCDDLPDFEYYSSYEDGMSPEECAQEVLAENGFDTRGL